jgi:twitching motility protein PilT
LQENETPSRSLAQICLDHGYLRREAINEAMSFQQQIQRRLDAEASLFGRVAMAMRLLTREQVNAALSKQVSAAYQRRLGEVCVELGFLGRAQVDAILAEQESVKRRMQVEAPMFGRIAIELAMLSAQQVAECVTLQREEGGLRRIGEICVERGYLEPAQVTEILKRQQDARQTATTGIASGPGAGTAPSAPARAEAPGSARSTAATRDAPRDLATAASSPSSAAGEPAINAMLRQMINFKASDLHLSADCVPLMRIHGEMRAAGKQPLGNAQLRKLLLEIIPKGPRDDFDQLSDADFAHEVEGLARFRVNYFLDRKGICGVFRQIPYEIQRPETLGLPPQVIDLCWLSKGLVLVTGPTGSGKSTTLAALVDYVNRHRTDHIVTIEDPIEFVHQNKKCLVNQREVGTHTQSFKNALRAALREDPDVVLVGELRDLETVAIAIETAETGHLVFGTLHTTSAPGTVSRVIEQFPGDQQAQIRTMLSESLRGVIAQMLCKKAGGGRVAAFEILLGTPAVANIIREGKTEQLISVMQMGRQLGMQTMNEHFLSLVRDGIVEPGEAYLRTNDKRGLKEQLDRLGIELPKEMVAEIQLPA